MRLKVTAENKDGTNNLLSYFTYYVDLKQIKEFYSELPPGKQIIFIIWLMEKILKEKEWYKEAFSGLWAGYNPDEALKTVENFINEFKDINKEKDRE